MKKKLSLYEGIFFFEFLGYLGYFSIFSRLKLIFDGLPMGYRRATDGLLLGLPEVENTINIFF
jgi:hypothetical protein